MNLPFGWRILNPKHEILNKFKLNPFRVCGDVGRTHENSKFKTNLSKQTFTKERFRRFCHWDFGNLILFSFSDLGFRIYRAITEEETNAIFN